MALLFAFGTLKRGFPLHEEGLAGAKFLGRARTVEPYPMLVAGPWYAPMMLDRPGEGLRVRGELYEVDEARLAALDRLESVGKPGNRRKPVRVQALDGGGEREAFAFMKDEALAKPAHSGWLEEYLDRRFVPFDKR